MKHIFLMKSSLSIICFLIFALVLYLRGFPVGTSGKEPTCQCRRHKRHRFNPWVGKIPWTKAWQSTPVFLPGESHGWRSLVGYSSCGHKETDTTKQLSTLHARHCHRCLGSIREQRERKVLLLWHSHLLFSFLSRR